MLHMWGVSLRVEERPGLVHARIIYATSFANIEGPQLAAQTIRRGVNNEFRPSNFKALILVMGISSSNRFQTTDH
jgi:hypothetical protein